MEIAVYIVSLSYLVLTVPAIILLKRKLSHPSPNKKPVENSGTLIIPVKDEESVLPLTIGAISNSITLLNVIYVNDGSSDNTEKIILDCIKKNPNISILKKEHDNKTNQAPRQKVINFAIEKCNKPIIAITDADCSPCENWDSIMLSNISQENVAMCYGYTRIDSKDCKKWGYIEWVELFFLFACAFGLKFLKLPSSCMGNNIVIKKDLLEKIGGYESLPYAYNDDQIIMKIFRKQFGDKSVSPVYNAVMNTLPLNNFTKAMNQKLRWLIEGVLTFPSVAILLAALLFCSVSLIFFSSIVAKIVLFFSVLIFCFFWSKVLNEKNAVPRAILMYLCIYALPIIYLVFSIKGLLFGVTWKNSKVKFKDGS